MKYIIDQTPDTTPHNNRDYLSSNRQEAEYIWKNMIRIEQLKKEKLRQKNENLRRILHQQ